MSFPSRSKSDQWNRASLEGSSWNESAADYIRRLISRINAEFLALLLQYERFSRARIYFVELRCERAYAIRATVKEDWYSMRPREKRELDILKRENLQESVTRASRAFITSLGKPTLVAVLIIGMTPLLAGEPDPFAPLPSADPKIRVVAFGDSLMDAGIYSPVAESTFGGGRFTTNPGTIFAQEVARHYGDILTPACVGGFGVPLSWAGGLDYARGGSRVALQPGLCHAPAGTPNADFAEETTIPVKDQVASYLSAHGRFTSSTTVLQAARAIKRATGKLPEELTTDLDAKSCDRGRIMPLGADATRAGGILLGVEAPMVRDGRHALRGKNGFSRRRGSHRQ